MIKNSIGNRVRKPRMQKKNMSNCQCQMNRQFMKNRALIVLLFYTSLEIVYFYIINYDTQCSNCAYS